jgi:hypothetical protein
MQILRFSRRGDIGQVADPADDSRRPWLADGA